MPLSGHALPARLDAPDRDAVGQTGTYSDNAVAPHGVTGRFSYTVPSEKIAVVEHATAVLTRVTAAAPVGRAQAYIDYDPAGAAASARIVNPVLWGNAVGSSADQAVGRSVTLLAGATLGGNTEDGSTGGTIDYRLYCHLLEYDA